MLLTTVPCGRYVLIYQSLVHGEFEQLSQELFYVRYHGIYFIPFIFVALRFSVNSQVLQKIVVQVVFHSDTMVDGVQC